MKVVYSDAFLYCLCFHVDELTYEVWRTGEGAGLNVEVGDGSTALHPFTLTTANK